MKIFILLLAGAQVSGLPRENCTSVDLREKGQSFFDMPVFNQGSSDYCWAFAGTQMVSALLRNTSQNKYGITKGFAALSPTVTMNNAMVENLNCYTPCSLVQSVLKTRKGCAAGAVTFHDGENKFHPDTGLMVRRQNKCTVKRGTITNVEQTMGPIFGSMNSEQIKLRNKFSYLAMQITEKNPAQDTIKRQKALKGLMGYKSAMNQLSYAFLYNATMAPTCLDLENKDQPFQGTPQINKLIDETVEQSVSCTEFRAPIFQKAIESDSKGDCPTLNSAEVVGSEILFRKINQAFDSTVKFPVAIDYCYSFLFEGEPGSGENLCQLKNGNKTSDHKSILVARRFNEGTKTCEFLIRNSFGNDCSKLHENFRKRCEDEKQISKAADIWVAADLLEKVVHGVSLLSN